MPDIAQTDYLSFINTPYFWILAIVIGIIIIIIYFLNKRKKSDFQGKKAFRDIVQENIKNMIKTFGIKTSGKLYYGIHEIGIINKMCYLMSNPKKENSVATEILDTKITNIDTHTFTLLRMRKKGILNSFMASLGMGIFFILIQKELITIREKKMYIDGSLRFDEFGKVWLLAQQSNIDIIENLYWKDNYETSLGELSEFPKKISYLETALGREVEKIDKTVEAIDSSKKSKMRKFF